MYKVLSVFIITFLILPLTFLQAQNKFEGKVVFQVEEDGNSETISYLVKGSKYRIEPQSNQGMGDATMLYDADKKVMYMLMDDQKMYMEMPIDIGKEIAKDEADEDSYFKNTGEVKNINGYDCEKFLFKDSDNSEGVAWMTKELGSFMFMGDPEDMESSTSEWQKEIVAEGYFPMLVQKLDGTKVFEVLELKKMNLDDALFSIPSGYSKFDMPGMNMDHHK